MAPETLYNSIDLPAVWPPRSMDENSLEPAPVPYLEDRPATIDIDLGRPRGSEVRSEKNFIMYVERIRRHFMNLGVLSGA